MTTDCIIGLDISTSCTGIAALDESGNVLAMVEHKPKGETLVEKAADFKRSLLEFVSNNSLNPTNVYIEQNLQRFRRGFSSAQVINKLARYNGMCSLVVYESLSIQPVYINVNEGRKSLGIKIPRGSDTKEEIFTWCKTKYPNVVWPKKKMKSGPRKGLVIDDPCCYDIADAIVTACAGQILNDSN